MMKYIKYIHIVCSIACFMLNQNLSARLVSGPQINLFFKPYPEFTVSDEENLKTSKKFSRPDYTSKFIIKDFIDPNAVNGIFATYKGFINTSNPDGQIIFPRKQEEPIVHLIVTTRLTPIMMNNTTIAHWELEENVPAAMYKFERIKDEVSDMFIWKVSKEELPEKGIIPTYHFDYIHIFAKPENIYVPLGATVTKDGENLLLPDIYVKPEINKMSNALYVLYMRHFFGPIRKEVMKEKTHYRVILTS